MAGLGVARTGECGQQGSPARVEVFRGDATRCDPVQGAELGESHWAHTQVWFEPSISAVAARRTWRSRWCWAAVVPSRRSARARYSADIAIRPVTISQQAKRRWWPGRRSCSMIAAAEKWPGLG